MWGTGGEVSQGGEVEGADDEQTGKRERGDEPAHQPVRHSLWEQSSLGTYNELLFGCLDGEVAALQQRKAEYDEAKRQSDGSDTCGGCSDSDSGSVAELVVERRQGSLQPMLGKRVRRVESALHTAELAPKRLRNGTMGQYSQGRQQKKGMDRRRGGIGRRGQGHGKWSMPGFSVDPGGGLLVAGRYTVEAIQSQVIQQGPAGKEIWLADDLRRGKGGEKVIAWMQRNELQRGAAGNDDWLARLPGKARED